MIYCFYFLRKTKKIKFGVQGEILFGIHPIQLALMAKRRHFYKLYIKETPDNQARNQSYINLLLTAEGMVEKQWVDRHVLDNLAGFRPHQVLFAALILLK
jgi:tRNA G18 (ribose-2'-O)-methylase SpoU